jgi:hypothetical protein
VKGNFGFYGKACLGACTSLALGELMASKTLFNVVHRKEEWHVLKDGSKSSEGHFQHKADAVDRGRELAMREEVGQLRVSNLDGSVQSEMTFGKDPSQIEG